MRFRKYLGEEENKMEYDVLEKLWKQAGEDVIKFKELSQNAVDGGEISFEEGYPVAIKNFLKSKGIDEE